MKFRNDQATRKTIKSSTVIWLLAVAWTMMLACAAQANVERNTQKTFQLNIQRGSVEAALKTLAQQAQMQVIFPFDLVTTLEAKPLKGQYTVLNALDILLKDTGLSGSLTESGVITIVVDDLNKNGKGKRDMDSKKKLLASTVAFFMGSGVQGVLAQEDVGGQEENGWLLEEVVVTASKRQTSLQDTAVAISVLSSDVIEKRGLVEMKDYLATLPGLSYIKFNADDNRIIFRGLSVGPTDQQTTSGSYLGEMPMSTASKAAFGIKLVDLERIEVLRGPQGTLFGSSALGGTVRNIPIAPNLEELEGYVTVDASSQAKSNDANHSVIGAINLPLIDDALAIRVAAYHYENAGYIDAVSNPIAESVAAASGSNVLVKDDINDSTYTGGRASMLWSAVEKLEVNLIIGTQDVDGGDTDESLLSMGGYQTNLLNSGANRNDTSYGNLVVEIDIDWGTIISSSSIVKNETFRSGNSLAVYSDSIFASALGPTETSVLSETDILTQEIRLASRLDGPLQFLAGFFYEDVERDNHSISEWTGSDTSASPFGLLILDQQQSLNYEQKAIFGEVSYQFNDEWLLTLGGRHFDYDRIDTITHPRAATFNPNDSEEDISESGNRYKANLSFTPNEATLIYGQWSEGFRLGKGQGVPPAASCDIDNNGKLDFTNADLTSRVEADTTENFELGTKFSKLDKRLTINSALFRINWKNIPVTIQNSSESCAPLFSIINNVGEARSQGIEIETSYVLSPNIIINLAASYMDTEWTEVRDPVIKGERLVYAPRTNANLGVEYKFMLDSYPSFVRTDISYIGEYETWNKANPSPTGGDYVSLNLRAGVNVEQWTFSIYVSNLTNEDDSLLFNGFNGQGPITRTPPRKFGAAFNYRF